MKTLYLSDLDGTLLRSDETLSEYTMDVLNRNTDHLFSIATARSISTASEVLEGIYVSLPMIVHNGTMIVNSLTHERLHYEVLDPSIHQVIDMFIEDGHYPIVYSFIEGRERFSYIEKYLSPEQKAFLKTRHNDLRQRPVHTLSELHEGEIYYVTLIGKKTLHVYLPLLDTYQVIFDKDTYTDSYWLEIMPAHASKAQAALRLKDMLGCDRLVVFGDGLNDKPLFEVADEAYAMTNGHPALKEMATAVIPTNDEDGVAKYLKEVLWHRQ